MRRLAIGLLVVLSLAACSKPADPTPELRAENASLRQEVQALERRVAGLEKQNAALDNRLAIAEERLRDVAGVMDKAMVRLDRVDR